MDFEIDGVFKPFLDGLFLGVLMVDKSGRIVYANQRLLEMDELTPEDTLGYRISEVYSLREEDSPTMKALSTGQPVSEFMTYKTARGKQFSTMNNSYPLYRGDELVGVITLATDVTSLLASALPRGSHLAGQKPAPEPEDEDGIVKFDSLIGKSPLFREAIDVAKVAAAGPSPVMLIGETGVGKDLFAKAIHDFGARAGKKFMAVNCSAIPEALLEGILFGTAKGAFTGATDRVGLLEHASGGTLFLDEINSMPMVLQTKLLRVLQDHKVRRVGGLSEKKVDLRIISATNVNPLAAVAAKSLRADLYYRLGVVQVRIPPLRERREDIPYLARYFVDKLKHKLGKEVAGISEGLTQSLKQRAWQGNVRELEHVIESAMNFVSHGDILGERHVKRASRNVEQFGSVPNLTGGQLPWTDQKEAARLAGKHEAGLARVFKDGDVARPQGPRKAMVRFKWEQESEDRDSLVEALTLNRGIVSRAAAYLGMSQQLASYRMKKYKLKREDYVHK